MRAYICYCPTYNCAMCQGQGGSCVIWFKRDTFWHVWGARWREIHSLLHMIGGTTPILWIVVAMMSLIAVIGYRRAIQLPGGRLQTAGCSCVLI